MKAEFNLSKEMYRAVAAAGGVCKVGERLDFGWPDRLILLPGGRVHWAELKTDTGADRDGQHGVNALLRALGQDVQFVRGERGLEEYLARIL